MKKIKPVSVFFMVPSPPGIAPGQRFRFEHYLPLLEEKGIKYTISPYFTLEGRKSLHSQTSLLTKALIVSRGYIKRIGNLFVIKKYDYVYIHKETTPVGPPIIPWVMTKILRKKIIYDFDDAIWVAVMSKYNRRFSFIKSFGKVARICRWSYKVTVGNTYLKEYADRYNTDVAIIPTVVDTDKIHNRVQNQEVPSPAIGWTGSFSTLAYLDMVVPILREIQQEIDFTFYVIADKDPELPLANYKFIRWRKETEIDDLLKFHIGIMPLKNDEFSKGKCGFKAIQYMALGIPAIVSPVGVNAEIVSEGESGFICDSAAEWKKRLTELLKESSLRKKLAMAAIEKIRTQYSVKATEELFLDLFADKTT